MSKIDKLDEILSEYDSIPCTFDINYVKIPVNHFDISEKGMNEFNKVYKALLECKDEFFTITRTKSGGISKKELNLPAYDIQYTNNSLELTILSDNAYRFLFRTKYTKFDGGCSGREGFNTFKKVCEKHNVDLDKLAIDNGLEVKNTIEKVHIGLKDGLRDLIYEHVYHIDLNSAYVSGIMLSFPELEPVIKEIYKERKNKNLPEKQRALYKSILNVFQGYAQSIWCRIGKNTYALSHLSKAGIAFCNRQVERIAKNIEDQGGLVLAYNTDGLFYIPAEEKTPYHDEYEGTELCQWKHDHNDITIRFKSDGAYEYIENGKYTPVVRGSTRLDKVKPREEWKWGDIYQDDAVIITYNFIENIGIVEESNNE